MDGITAAFAERFYSPYLVEHIQALSPAGMKGARGSRLRRSCLSSEFFRVNRYVGASGSGGGREGILHVMALNGKEAFGFDYSCWTESDNLLD